MFQKLAIILLTGIFLLIFSFVLAEEGLQFETPYLAEKMETLIELKEAKDIETFQEKLEEVIVSVFPSLSPPVIFDVKVEDITPNSVTIYWKTNVKASSFVAFAPDDEYQIKKDYLIEVGNPEERVLEHKVILMGLTPDTLYHFQVKSVSIVGVVGKSEDKVFKTPPLSLTISDINFKLISGTEVSISWKTNIPSATKIEYTNLRTGEKKEIEDPSFLKDHLLKLKNLEGNTDYSFVIKARDEKGNTASSPTLTFSTGKDITPPKISQVRTSSAISPKGDSVLTIITWLTDEPSTSRVYYVPGTTWKDELVISTPLDKNLVKKHTVVISAFKPAQVYRFRVESIDSSGNVSISKDFTLLTPQQRKSIIQIITENLERTFDWVNRIRF